jgi:hypothetical protein
MGEKPLAWKVELGSASAFSAQLGKAITYYAVTRAYGYLAYVELRGSRGGLKRLDLGYYVKIEQAKKACEQHCADGCDLSKAKKIIRGDNPEGMLGSA